jgi:hypothetical protein
MHSRVHGPLQVTWHVAPWTHLTWLPRPTVTVATVPAPSAMTVALSRMFRRQVLPPLQSSWHECRQLPSHRLWFAQESPQWPPRESQPCPENQHISPLSHEQESLTHEQIRSVSLHTAGPVGAASGRDSMMGGASGGSTLPSPAPGTSGTTATSAGATASGETALVASRGPSSKDSDGPRDGDAAPASRSSNLKLPPQDDASSASNRQRAHEGGCARAGARRRCRGWGPDRMRYRCFRCPRDTQIRQEARSVDSAPAAAP